MILTGRTGLLALICVLPIALSPWPARAFVMLLVALAVAVTVDTLLAASTRKLRFTRSPYTSARLGQPVDASLLLCNGGRRRFRGQVRDAWPPSARAQPHTHDVDVAAGQRQQVHTALRPVRRGDQRAAMVTARSIGPLGLAGRQSSQSVPGLVRVLPPFLSRKHLPSRLAKLREIDGLLPTLIRGQGTEFDSLREYVVATTSARSIGARAHAAPMSWSAPGGPNGTAESSSCSTPDAWRRGGSVSTRPPPIPPGGRGWTGPWMPHCCWRHWRHEPATMSTSWPTTGSAAPACLAPRVANCLPNWSMPWPRCDRRLSNPTGMQ